jgi:hypothetical protein
MKYSNVNFKGFPEERFLEPLPAVYCIDVSLYQNWTPSFRTLAKKPVAMTVLGSTVIACSWTKANCYEWLSLSKRAVLYLLYSRIILIIFSYRKNTEKKA